jgi:MFS family permease
VRHDSRWVTFTLVAAAQFMVVLDTAIINVALPVIKVNLGFSDTSIQWAVTAYVLAFGGFLLFGGRAADLYSGAAACCWPAWPRSRCSRC